MSYIVVIGLVVVAAAVAVVWAAVTKSGPFDSAVSRVREIFAAIKK
jgi:hypothetical protein